MNLLEDTRQKIGAHEVKHKTWDDAGDVVYRCTLPYGDYALPPKISIDSKQNLEEICKNLCGARKERERVEREEKRAKALGGKLIFLIETESVSTKTDLLDRKILLRSGVIVEGEQLMRAMDQHEAVYGSEFVFCSPSESAEKIKELLVKGG